MLTLYHCDSSYASQILRLFLQAMSIDWQSHHVDLRKQEHITSDYRQINPNGTVPSLKDTNYNKLITNSTDIMIHLEQHYLTDQQRPTELLRQRIHAFCFSQEGLHDPHLRTLSYVKLFLAPEAKANLDLEKLQQTAKNHPNKKRGEFLQRAATGKITQQEIDTANQAIADYLLTLDSLLQQQESSYLFDNKLTMADAAAIAALFRIKKLAMGELIAQHERIEDYYQRMQRCDFFESAKLI